MGLDALTLVFWMLSFKPAFPLSSFTLIKKLFTSSSLSAISVISSAYLWLLMLLLAILIPACVSFTLASHKMYSAFKLNKHSDNIQSWHAPSLTWNQSVVPYLVLIVASWLAYRFLRRQDRWSVIPISWRIFHSLLWSTTFIGFGIVNKAEVDVFLGCSCFFHQKTPFREWKVITET